MAAQPYMTNWGLKTTSDMEKKSLLRWETMQKLNVISRPDYSGTANQTEEYYMSLESVRSPVYLNVL